VLYQRHKVDNILSMNKNKYIFLLIFIVAGFIHMPAIFADRESDANKYYLDAYNLYKLGKLDESLVVLKKVVEISPDHAEAHFGMGSIYFRQNMFDEAIMEFTKVTRLKPQYVEAYQRLWLAYKKLGMNDKAEEELAKYKKLIEERMLAMGGGSPQVVKPVSPPKEEEKPQEKPREEKAAPPEETNLSERAVSQPIVPESKPPVVAAESKKEDAIVVKPETPPQEMEKGSSYTYQPKPLAETKPVEAKPPVEVKLKEKTDLSLERSPTVKLDSVYETPYIKIDRNDPRYKDLFSPFQKKKSSSTWIKNPFTFGDFGKMKMPYVGKLLKGIISYVIIVQIWLCIVASLFIYFTKKRGTPS